MRRFGKLTASNTPILMVVLLGLRVIGTLLGSLYPAAINWICFNPQLILRGQIWRLFTFVMFPYGFDVSSLFFLAIMVFVFFSISQTLIMVIGKYRLNFFLISGLILEVIFGFLYYYLSSWIESLSIYSHYVVYLNPSYLYSMLFVLLAMLFPEMRFYLLFIIPIKGKWLVFITLGLYLFEVVQAFLSIDFGYAWLLVMMIIAAILTILFFLLVFRKNSSFANAHKTVSKSTESRQKSDSGPTKMHSPFRGEARHKCTICGRTEKTNPELEFRYCSKCVGNYEYCMDHLYTHLHKYPNVTDNVSK